MQGLKSIIASSRKWLPAAAATLVVLFGSTEAWSQTCPLCYRAAAASKAGAIAALRRGVLILMLPPVAIFGIVTWIAIRRRDRFNEAGEGTPSELSAAEPELEASEALEEEDHAWR